MTHDHCVNLAAVWLSNRKASGDQYRCKVILKEMIGYQGMLYGSEQPDVIGIWGIKSTVNIECKVSRSDFLANKNKRHNHPFGNYKLFACPAGMIKPEEIPDGFGLIYVDGRGGRVVKHAVYVESEADVTPMLCDIIINGENAGVLTSEHKRRPRRMWDGKAVVL